MERVRNRIPRLGVLAALLFRRLVGGRPDHPGADGFVTTSRAASCPAPTVIAVHGADGGQLQGRHRADGTFVILNVRVGPYAVTAACRASARRCARKSSWSSARTRRSTQAPARDGQETVTVTAESSAIYSGSKAGPAQACQGQIIETLRHAQPQPPTTPGSRLRQREPERRGPGQHLHRGRPNRYNNIQIAARSTTTCLGSRIRHPGRPDRGAHDQPRRDPGTAGGGVALRRAAGGFAGGGVNAITRTGTTAAGVRLLLLARPGLVGDGPFDTPVGESAPGRGASLGGPDREEHGVRLRQLRGGPSQHPVGLLGWTVSRVCVGFQAEAQRISTSSRNQYGYDPGGLEQFTRATPNNKFLRGERFQPREPEISCGPPQLHPTPTTTAASPARFTYLMPDFYYQFRSQTNSTVGQLNSTFGRALTSSA